MSEGGGEKDDDDVIELRNIGYLQIKGDVAYIRVDYDEGEPMMTTFKLAGDAQSTLNGMERSIRRLNLDAEAKKELLGTCTDAITKLFLERAKKESAQALQQSKWHEELIPYDQKARELLSSPGLLYSLEDAICARGSDEFLIGEEESTMYLLFNVVGGTSVEVRGLTAGGKNALVDHVLSVIPQWWWRKITGLTDKAIRYLPEDVRILYVAERRGMGNGEETTAEYDVKVGISEGKITVALAVATEGDVVTVFKDVKIDLFLFTSTEIEAPPELENRLSTIVVRDDPLQNQIVRDEQLAKAKMFAWQKKDYSEEKKVAQRCIQLVDEEAPREVIIPYTSSLKPILNANDTVVRRNTPKVLHLVKAVARLHYKQRPIMKGPDGKKEVLVALPADLWMVLGIGQRALQQTLSVMPEKLEAIIDICRELSDQGSQLTTRSILEAARGKAHDVVRNIRTVQQAVKALDERGILARRYDTDGKIEKGDHGAYVYDLIDTAGSGIRLDIPALLSEANGEFETWWQENKIGNLSLFPSAASWLGGLELDAAGRKAPEEDAVRSPAPVPECDTQDDSVPSGPPVQSWDSTGSEYARNNPQAAPNLALHDSDGSTVLSKAASDRALSGIFRVTIDAPDESLLSSLPRPDLIESLRRLKDGSYVNCHSHPNGWFTPEQWQAHLTAYHGEETSRISTIPDDQADVPGRSLSGDGICAVCGRPGGKPHVISGYGVVFLHPGCETKWEGKL